MGTALVTGATAGIGRYLAEHLATKGQDLILVARDEQRLRQVADELPTACEILAADLADRAQLAAVEDRAAEVDWLVNNAGFGLNESFLNSDVEAEQRLLDVLVTAVMRLSHAALPGMVERNHGRILNVSSVAGWVPFGTYSAAKAWVTNFSEGLAGQTPENVHVTALCPGYTRTEFHRRADMDMRGLPEMLWLDASDVAAAGINDCEAGKILSVPGWQYKPLRAAVTYAPRRLLHMANARMNRA